MANNEIDENRHNFSLIKYLSLQKWLLAAEKTAIKSSYKEKKNNFFSEKKFCKQDINKNNRNRNFQQYQSEILEHKEQLWCLSICCLPEVLGIC